MTKGWTKTGDSSYAFSVDGHEVGRMSISVNSLDRRADLTIGQDTFMIRQTGFWKSTTELTNQQGVCLIKAYQEKWYANSSILEFDGKQYKLVVRNNPLAEWAILDGEKELLAYGLTTENGKVSIRITSAETTTSYLPDFLLWYLFVPIATENLGDSFLFLMLMIS